MACILWRAHFWAAVLPSTQAARARKPANFVITAELDAICLRVQDSITFSEACRMKECIGPGSLDQLCFALPPVLELVDSDRLVVPRVPSPMTLARARVMVSLMNHLYALNLSTYQDSGINI